MKFSKLLIAVLIGSSIFMGCGNKEAEEPTPTNPSEDTGTEDPSDASTSPSMVADEVNFVKALGENGPWIIIATQDITSDQELVLSKIDNLPEGKTGRNITLYSNDENQNVKDQFTLTAKRLTIQGDNVELKRGTFVGDLYVEGENFQIIATTVTGNIYFMNEKAKETFKLAEDATVSGVQELKQ